MTFARACEVYGVQAVGKILQWAADVAEEVDAFNASLDAGAELGQDVTDQVDFPKSLEPLLAATARDDKHRLPVLIIQERT